MNMNYDLMTWVEYFAGAFACCLGLFLTGTIVTYKKLKKITIFKYGLFIIYSAFILFNSLIFDNIVKMFGTLLILYLMFKTIFNEDKVNSIKIAIITYIITILSEITVSVSIALIENLFKVNIMTGIIKSILINVIIAILSCVYAYFIRKKLNSILNKINFDNISLILILAIIGILVIFSSMYNLYLNDWNINYEFILNIIIIFGCLYILINLIKQNLKNYEITEKYILVKDYLKTSADLVEKYSSTIHKYKNNLIVIKGYLKSDIKEANNYIDTLLENYKTKKYSWFSKLNYIQIDIVRYLVYYKLSKAETSNLKILVDVSSSVKRFTDDNLTIYEINILSDIIGEYFDNAIYASNESQAKELNFSLYMEDDKLKFVLANTYKEKVDLSLITKNGYTTKGKDHGLGLYDIDKTLKSFFRFKVKYELLDNYFVVSLTINI